MVKRLLNFKKKSRVIKAPENLTQDGQALLPGPRIIAVTSGKGGVGKTSFTINLAISLARAGHRVVVFDADLGLANAEIMMGISPDLTLYDCIRGQAGIKDILTPGPAGVRLVSGGSGFMEMANLNQDTLQQLLDSMQILDGEADFILVDTGAGISKIVLGFVAAVHEIILVITPEPTSITDGYSLAKIVSEFKLPVNVNIVINRASDFDEAQQIFSRFDHVCTKFLGLSINYLGYIKEDRSVSKSIIAQVPLMSYNNSSAAAKNIEEITAKIVAGNIENNSQHTGVKEFVTRLVRLFRR